MPAVQVAADLRVGHGDDRAVQGHHEEPEGDGYEGQPGVAAPGGRRGCGCRFGRGFGGPGGHGCSSRGGGRETDGRTGPVARGQEADDGWRPRSSRCRAPTAAPSAPRSPSLRLYQGLLDVPADQLVDGVRAFGCGRGEVEVGDALVVRVPAALDQPRGHHLGHRRAEVVGLDQQHLGRLPDGDALPVPDQPHQGDLALGGLGVREVGVDAAVQGAVEGGEDEGEVVGELHCSRPRPVSALSSPRGGE